MKLKLDGKTGFFIYLVGVSIGVSIVFLREQIIMSEIPGEETTQVIEPKIHSDSSASSSKKVRILCWVMTSPSNLRTKAQHVKETWWKHCDVKLFVSSEKNDNFPVVDFEVKEGRQHLYSKTVEAFRYAFENFVNDADWFMKADDDAYVLVENLRHFLEGKNPNEPIYFGRPYKGTAGTVYMSGGAGYIFSREALKRYVRGINSGYSACFRDGLGEDVAVGWCMSKMGVTKGDARDSDLREQFHAFDIVDNTWKVEKYMNYQWDYHCGCASVCCTTRTPITFHYVTPERMYLYEYLFHKVQVNGRCENGYAET